MQVRVKGQEEGQGRALERPTMNDLTHQSKMKNHLIHLKIVSLNSLFYNYNSISE